MLLQQQRLHGRGCGYNRRPGVLQTARWLRRGANIAAVGGVISVHSLSGVLHARKYVRARVRSWQCTFCYIFTPRSIVCENSTLTGWLLLVTMHVSEAASKCVPAPHEEACGATALSLLLDCIKSATFERRTAPRSSKFASPVFPHSNAATAAVAKTKARAMTVHRHTNRKNTRIAKLKRKSSAGAWCQQCCMDRETRHTLLKAMMLALCTFMLVAVNQGFGPSMKSCVMPSSTSGIKQCSAPAVVGGICSTTVNNLKPTQTSVRRVNLRRTATACWCTPASPPYLRTKGENTRPGTTAVWSGLVWSGLVWSGLVWSGRALVCAACVRV